MVLGGKFDSFLDVFWRSSIDANDWHAPLLAWKTERSVEVAGLDRPVRKGVRLLVSVFSGARLIRTPDPVEPASADIRTVSRGRVVAWSGWGRRVDQWLGDL